MTRQSNIAEEYPLTSEQMQALEAAASGLASEQLLWVSGYLAGLARGRPQLRSVGGSAQESGSVGLKAHPAAAQRVTVLYGSETGNAKGLAERLARDLTPARASVAVMEMDDYRPARLRQEKNLLIVVSTHGEGDPPEGAEAFFEYLLSDRAPELAQLNYAVLALGDSSYAQFCAIGKQIDARLSELGARRIRDRIDCDVDFQQPADRWIESVCREFAEKAPPENGAVDVSSITALAEVASPRAVREFDAELTASQRLTPPDGGRDVRHLEFLLPEEVDYRPGDALAVQSENPPELVEAFLERFGLSGAEDVTVGEEVKRVSEALGRHLEITRLSRTFLERYAAVSESDRLQKLLEPGGESELADALATRQVIDIVDRVPAKLTAQELAGCLRPLGRRSYSIASSLGANPQEAHMTVAPVRYEHNGFTHFGTASTWLSDRLESGRSIRLRLEPNPRFHLPDDPAARIIMIGPGTGVAPFRAFLQEREVQGAAGDNWLFFGAPHFRTDFLYQIEWLRYRKQGLLTRMDVAFSRDQSHKVYVQHRLAERGRDVYRWLEEGAYLYVCGSLRMAPEVHAALVDIICREGGKRQEQAEDYLRSMKRTRRYRRDVY